MTAAARRAPVAAARPGHDRGTRLRVLESADLAAVVALERTVHGRRAWSLDTFRAEIARDDREYVVAETPDRGEGPPRAVVGYAGAADVASDLHIATLVVAPAARRQGLGSLLVTHLLESGARRGLTAATLEVRAGNAAARELYRRCGFAPVGVRPGYYPGDHPDAPPEDAVIMWLHDLDRFRRDP